MEDARYYNGTNVPLVKSISTWHRCAKCKGPMTGCRNGDLHCQTCNIWCDPDEPTEADRIEDALFSNVIQGWESHKKDFVEEPESTEE